MSISQSAWQQSQYNLVEDFFDLFLPPSYPLAIETNWPKSAPIEALIENRWDSLDLPEPKLLRIEQLLEGSWPEDFPRKESDWIIMFAYQVLEGFGHELASNLEGPAFEGLRQLATIWGSYIAREVERLLRSWQLFTAFSDFMLNLVTGLFCQIPAKELGEALRESINPAYIRAGELASYEFALFNQDQARMKESLDMLEASDTELEREIANMFRGCSTKQVGRQMQQMVIEAVSQLRELFPSNEFREKFSEKLPAAVLILCKNMSWRIGHDLSRNLQYDRLRTERLLETVNRHKEIMATMEQYRYRHGWQGDRNKAVAVVWQAVGPKYFRLGPRVEGIMEDRGQEKLIGVAQGLENYTDKNRAIEALSDGFLGRLGAYLAKAAKNQATDYARKQDTDGNRALTEAKHDEDLRHADRKDDVELTEEILSREKEKYYPSRDSIVEELELKETVEGWYKSLTESEKTATNLKSAGHTEVKIAGMMGISQQRVSQLLQQSLEKYQRLKVRP